MNQRRFGLRAASGLSLFLAVAIFALMALLTVVLGAGGEDYTARVALWE